MATGKRQIRRFQRSHSSLKTSQQGTPSIIYKLFILPETRVIGLHFLTLIVWVYVHSLSRNYASNSNPLKLKLLVRKPSFTWNSHSRPF